MTTKAFSVDTAQFVRVKTLKLKLDYFFVLSLAADNLPIPPEALDDMSFLVRKRWVDGEWKITETGKQMYKEFSEKVAEQPVNLAKKPKHKEKDSFDEWWAIYPSTDYFEHKGKTFQGTQSKKTRKDECRRQFIVLCNSNFTAEQIIRATKFHIELAKNQSVIKKDNQLSYIANSERYLREKKFEPYVSLSLTKKLEDNVPPTNSVINL